MQKIVVVVLIAFALFYVFSQPENAADAVRGLGDRVGDAFDQVSTFVNTLFA